MVDHWEAWDSQTGLLLLVPVELDVVDWVPVDLEEFAGGAGLVIVDEGFAAAVE